MVAGRLSPERFDKLSTQYEEEQKQVRQVIRELQSLINDGEQESHDLRQFLKSVRKKTHTKSASHLDFITVRARNQGGI